MRWPVLELGGEDRTTPPLVLLHGFTGVAESMRAVAERAHAPAVKRALALPGHHPAAPVAGSFAANVAQLADALRVLGPPAHLVGYSLGARLALGLLAEYPALVARATLIGVHPGLIDEQQRAARRSHDERWVRLLREHGIAAFVAQWEALPMWRTQHRCSGRALAAQRAARLQHDAEALARSLETMGLAEMPSYVSALAATEKPVELVTGAADAKFTAIAHDLLGVAPQLRHRSIADAGHNLVLEAPVAIWPEANYSAQ